MVRETEATEWEDRRRDWLDAWWNIFNSEDRPLESKVISHIRNAPNMNWLRDFENNDRAKLFSVLTVAISELYTENAFFRATLDDFTSARPDAAAEVGRFLGSCWVEVRAFEEMREKDEWGLEQAILEVLFQIRVWKARRNWLVAEMELGKHVVAGRQGFEAFR